jgi:hypothetical protein
MIGGGCVFVNLSIGGGSNSGVPLSRLSTAESGSRPIPRSLPECALRSGQTLSIYRF